MKKTKIFIMLIILLGLLINSSILKAQPIKPSIIIDDYANTHNMHICFDGEYYYTVNGGITDQGLINKYDIEGNFIATYDIYLDMRSIIYNENTEKFYLYCYDNNIYEITNFEIGAYKLIHKELITSEQATVDLSPDGKKLYFNDNGKVKIYDFSTGKLLKTFENIKCGKDVFEGSNAIAVSNKNIFTWHGKKREIYIYDLNGNYISTIRIVDGDYGFSLSYANNMIFTAFDGNYDDGQWYGYEIDDLIGVETLEPEITFTDNLNTHNMHLCEYKNRLYTINGGFASKGQINEYNSKGVFKKSYPWNWDMRSIMYDASNKDLYIKTHERKNNIYKITNLKNGKVEQASTNFQIDPQAVTALGHKGEKLYYFNEGELEIYNFKSTKLIKTITGLKHGKGLEGGSLVVAVDDKHIYTWNALIRLVYIHNLEGKYIKSVRLKKGNYAFSLSVANGLIFVAEDGNSNEGTWYGYKIRK